VRDAQFTSLGSISGSRGNSPHTPLRDASSRHLTPLTHAAHSRRAHSRNKSTRRFQIDSTFVLDNIAQPLHSKHISIASEG